MTERRRRSRRGRRSNEKYLFLGGIVLAVLLAFLIVTLSLNIRLTVEGANVPQVLVYGKDSYTPLAASATCNGRTIPVEVSGSVDETRVGTYEITYTARYLWVHKSVTRVIHVQDKTAPVIVLHTDPNYFPAPGEEYREEGYTATDDYDGDLTKFVHSYRDGDTVYYTVSDSSGNETTVERNIVRKDMTAPALSLKGNSVITIQAGTAYTEPGYTAVDDQDGDITNQVKISGSVNIYHADTYVLTYTSTDKAGNISTVTRTVIVEPIAQPPVVNPDGKVIYLTFDDGPERYTQELLDVLAKYNAKATFFVVNTGYNMKTLLNGIVDGGHGIGIHCNSHVYKDIYASEEAFFNDLYSMQKIIRDYTGVTTTMMRFPGGSSNTISRFNPGIMTRLTQAVQDQGFQYFDWHWDSSDSNPSLFTGTDEEKAAQVVQNVINGIGNKQQVVILQHDSFGYSVAAVEQILIWGLQNGYTFQALTPNSPECHHNVQN